MLEVSGAGVSVPRPLVNPGAPKEYIERIMSLGVIRVSVHTPIYTMHKFWARRPWRVFREIIARFTEPGDVILDPFAGGGVVLVEGLILRRRVVAVDLSPLAVEIMRREVEPLDLDLFRRALEKLSRRVEPEMRRLYATTCPRCGSEAEIVWTEYESASMKPVKILYECPRCGRREAGGGEVKLPEKPSLPPFKRVRIPPGDKTRDLLRRGYRFFDELFTERNLYAVLRLKEEIENMDVDPVVKSFLIFTLSSTLKWASKMSHRRGDVIEGWAMHAYWVYPRFLEINVWRQFLNRANAVIRGKEYSARYIGSYAVEARSFEELLGGKATYMVIQGDSRRLPLPDESVDAVITDPPYGGNVNYAELSDYFLWIFDKSSPKNEEIVVNETRGFDLEHYRRGLEEVFRECYRVLKPNGPLIFTFNSRDSRVVVSAIVAARDAGFQFVGVSEQPYLQAYETTFHALQVGAMTHDFIFFFCKNCVHGGGEAGLGAKSDINTIFIYKLNDCIKTQCTEREYRMSVYPELITYTITASTKEAIIAANTLERIIRDKQDYFSSVRKKLIERRTRKGM